MSNVVDESVGFRDWESIASRDETRDRMIGVAIAIVLLNIIWLFMGQFSALADQWPSHREAWSTLVELSTDGFQGQTLWENLGATLGRVGFAVAVGGVAGGIIGAVIGSSRRVWNLSDPFVSFARLIAPGELFVIGFFQFGIGEQQLLVGATLPIAFYIAHRVGRLILDARERNLSRVAVAGRHLTELTRTALLIAWFMVYGFELIASQRGVGAAIWTARTFFRIDIVVVTVMIGSVVMVAIDYLIRLAGRIVLSRDLG